MEYWEDPGSIIPLLHYSINACSRVFLHIRNPEAGRRVEMTEGPSVYIVQEWC